jgi:two-component sensor histidine kinase
MANNLNHLKRYSEAIEILNKAKQTVATTSGLVQVQERIYEMEYKIYQALDLPDQTLEAISQYLIFHDSLNRTSLKKQALELNTKYETERKEQEIELLNTKNELTLSELKGARRQAIGLAGGLLIFGVMIFFLFRLFRKTRTQNVTIKKALDEKELLLREIHHRVKNNLQFISSLLGLQSEHISDVTALSALQEGQDRVQSMALIHQNLYQEDNLTGVEIKDYFVKLIRNLFDSYNIRPGQVHLELDLANLNLDVDTVIPIGLIVNELVSNSLKYAFPDKRQGVIRVSLQEVRDRLQLQVSDDGKGMSDAEEAKLGTSFGYRLIQVFKDQLNAGLTIDRTNGTSVTMAISKYTKIG